MLWESATGFSVIQPLIPSKEFILRGTCRAVGFTGVVKSMSTEHSTLGVCPACETVIPNRHLLIEYERDDECALFAECPSCEVPVRPA